MTSADVVERVFETSRRALGCPKPSLVETRAMVEYVINRVRGTRGELVTLSMRLIKRYLTKQHLALRCIILWLGVEDCVFSLGDGKAILYAKCAREKLGL